MISTKGRYALRVVIDLAQQSQDNYIPLEEIANRQGISKKYLESILKTLVSEKLLKGLRGKGGGYKLTKKPEEYTVLQILELTEGSLASVACLEKNAEPCPMMSRCITYPMWEKYDRIIHDYFKNITIQDLIDNAPDPLAGYEELNYCI